MNCAAPCGSGFPSALTALPAQASRLHFLMKLVLAAPWSGWPAALTAWLSQDRAAAVRAAKQAINAARIMSQVSTPALCFTKGLKTGYWR